MNARARNQQFNDVERQWVAGFANGDPEDYRLTMNNPPWVRQKMKEIAFHEAGHVAARAFTGHEWSHIVLVSIIPNATTLGRETSVRNLTEMWLPVMPPPIALLAGREL